MTVHRAEWILPVSTPPLRDAVMSVEAGRIVDVSPYQGQAVDIDHGSAALVPGLVNAHVHLDLGALRQKLPPPAVFTDWLQAVIDYRRTNSAEEWDAAIQEGIAECLRTGTTLVGDISAGGRSAAWLRSSRLRSVAFYELIGLSRPRAEQSWAAGLAWLQQSDQSNDHRLGFSPHAPYTVNPWLFKQALAQAHRHGTPLAMHVAETPVELELLEGRTGSFRTFLERHGLWQDAEFCASLAEIVESLGSLPDSLLIHGNYLPAATDSGMRGSIVYCPRTHAYFGHEQHPFAEFLQAGWNVALGTDSLASNPDLSLWEEMRFLSRHLHAVPPETILRMGTLNGAQALGFAASLGSLCSGKVADFLVIRLPTKTGADPHRLLWEDDTAVERVFLAGHALSPP